MKVTRAMKMLVLLVGFAATGSSAYAQSEVDPDHFGSPNTEPFEKAKPSKPGEDASIHYEGRFSLPYSVKCNEKNLPPGEYSISLRSDGRVGRAILNQSGQAIGIAGIIHKQGHRRSVQTLIIEDEEKARRLSAIQVAEFDLDFDPDRGTGRSPRRGRRRIEKLPLVLVSRRN